MGANSSKKPSLPVFRTSKNAEKKPEGVHVFVGPFVHSVSWENPLEADSEGVIGVKDGKVIKNSYRHKFL